MSTSLAQDPNLQDIWHDFSVNKMNKTQLAAKYGISRWAVDRRLRKHGSSQNIPNSNSGYRVLSMPSAVRMTSSGDEVQFINAPYMPAYNTPVARAFETHPPRQDRPGSPRIPETVEEALEIWNEFIGYTGAPLITPDAPVKVSGEKKIVVINDIHAPFERRDAIRAMILENSHDTDLLIIGGDLLDLFSVSRYDKFSQHFTLSEEFRSGKVLLLELAQYFPKIVLLPGNHDERWKKWLVQRRGMGPSELEALSLLAQLATGDDGFDLTDPLYCLTRDIPNVELVRPVVRDYAQFGFFYQHGDMIVSHAEKFSRVPGQAANAAVSWFMSYGIPSGIIKPFSVFLQTHTHQAGMHYGNFGVWTFECGCLCKTPDYAANPKLMGAQRDSVLGYTVIYQDKDGKTDMRRSRFIPYIG